MENKFTVILGGFLAFAGMVGIFCLITGLPLMLLWNWLVPVIFHLSKITFWQAVGLQLMATLLFKSSSPSIKK